MGNTFNPAVSWLICKYTLLCYYFFYIRLLERNAWKLVKLILAQIFTLEIKRKYTAAPPLFAVVLINQIVDLCKSDIYYNIPFLLYAIQAQRISQCMHFRLPLFINDLKAISLLPTSLQPEGSLYLPLYVYIKLLQSNGRHVWLKLSGGY